jgi:hypothetical protein
LSHFSHGIILRQRLLDSRSVFDVAKQRKATLLTPCWLVCGWIVAFWGAWTATNQCNKHSVAVHSPQSYHSAAQQHTTICRNHRMAIAVPTETTGLLAVVAANRAQDDDDDGGGDVETCDSIAAFDHHHNHPGE